jgi:type IV pilus assembly protein PilM
VRFARDRAARRPSAQKGWISVLGGRFSASIGPVGIDFGSGSIRLIQVRDVGGSVEVLAADRVEVPPDGMTDPVALTAAVRGAFRSGGFVGRRCVVSLPRADVRIETVRMPVVNDERMRRAAVEEAARRFGLEPDAMEVDFLRTGATLDSGEGLEEILLVAAAHEAIRAAIYPLITAGLRPVAIDTDFAALARVFSAQCRRESDRTNVRAVLDVGRTGSTIMILRGDQVAFCKRIEIGGARFDEAVAEHLQMDPRAAAELRIDRQGGSGDTATDRSVYEAVRPLIGALIKEVTLCLRYYGVTFRGQPPARIVLTGGESLEPRLGPMLSASCRMPTVTEEEGFPVEALHEQIRARLQRDGGACPTWATAIGLSLRGLTVGGAAEAGAAA